MELELEFTFEATVSASALMVGSGPFGTRAVASVAGGWVKGDRINGTLVGAGADWVLIGPDGFGRLDVRTQIRTDDEAVLYLTYTGVLEMNVKTMSALAGAGETEFADHYYRVTPRLETGDPRYAWVNQTIFVGRGRLGPGRVLYEVYRVT